MERSLNIEQLDVNRLLEQWRWLAADPMTLVARNGFGDMFLRTTKGKIWWLNVGDGTLTEIAESESGFEHSLAESAKRELWFAEQQLAAFAEHGLKPNDLQCIGFKTPVVFAESANVPNNAYVACMNKWHSSGICIDRLPRVLTAERSGSGSASHRPSRD